MPPEAEPLLGEQPHAVWQMRKLFSAPLVAVLALLLGAFFALVRYPAYEATDAHVNQYYTFFIHIMIMIFVGVATPPRHSHAALTVLQVVNKSRARLVCRFRLPDDLPEVCPCQTASPE